MIRLWHLCGLAIATTVVVLLGCGGGADSADDERRGSGASADASSALTEVSFLSEVSLVDATEDVALDFVHETRSSGSYPMHAIMGGGAALIDADGDGGTDLYFVSGTPEVPDALFLDREGRYVEAASSHGLGESGYGMGAAAADVDNDGDHDLFVTAWGRDRLYVNVGGRFMEMADAAGVAGGEGWSASAVFFDFDRDGWLDLYVTRYVDYDDSRECALGGGRLDYCGPAQFDGLPDKLYRNLGAGADGAVRFEDVSVRANVAALADRGLGVVAADFDGDDWIDLYVANDSDPNHLWLNLRDGTFSEEAMLQGVAFNQLGVGEAGMGIALDDPDGDGDLDLFVSHLIEETNTFYENLGPMGFEDRSAQVGLAVASVPYTGFGTTFADLDNDGDLDLVIANGAVKRRSDLLRESTSDEARFWDAYVEPNAVFESVSGTWRTASMRANDLSAVNDISRGVLTFDQDADGDLDLLVTNVEGPARFYRNEGGNGRHWVTVEVVDPSTRRLALGALLTIVAGGRELTRPVAPAAGYLTSGLEPVHQGLGDLEAIDEMRVRWPDGSSEVFPGGAVDRRYVLELGSGDG